MTDQSIFELQLPLPNAVLSAKEKNLLGFEDKYLSQKEVVTAWFSLFFPELPPPADVDDLAWRVSLGKLLKRHLLFVNLLKILKGQIVSMEDLHQQMLGPLPESARAHIAKVLDALLVLVAWARNADGQPFVTLRVQLWMSSALDQITLALGGSAGCRLARQLGILASGSTLLRQLKRKAEAAVVAPRVVGIDEWAWRKGHRYGTILCDLEKGKAIDLLADRSVDSTAAWLRAHPGIEIVSRDRSSVYSEAAVRAAPQATQIADRWHPQRLHPDYSPSCRPPSAQAEFGCESLIRSASFRSRNFVASAGFE